jgi:hypothetical protein
VKHPTYVSELTVTLQLENYANPTVLNIIYFLVYFLVYFCMKCAKLQDAVVSVISSKGKGKAFPLQAGGAQRVWEVKASRFHDIGT